MSWWKKQNDEPSLNPFQATMERLGQLCPDVQFNVFLGDSAAGRAHWGAFETFPAMAGQGAVCRCNEIELQGKSWLRFSTMIVPPAPPQSQEALEITSRLLNGKIGLVSSAVTIEDRCFFLTTLLHREKGYTDDRLQCLVWTNRLLGLRAKDIFLEVHRHISDPKSAYLDFCQFFDCEFGPAYMKKGIRL